MCIMWCVYVVSPCVCAWGGSVHVVSIYFVDLVHFLLTVGLVLTITTNSWHDAAFVESVTNGQY